MTNKDKRFEESLGKALKSRTAGSAPGFEETWLAAEAHLQATRRQYRRFTGVAVSLALAAIVLGVLSQEQAPGLADFGAVTAVMNSTNWIAPSDALMPEDSTDVYGELPLFPVSTEIYEGALL